MAAVCAQLKFRDGQRQKICVSVENNLSSVINAIHELNMNVSSILNELVEREKTRGVCAEEEDEEGSDEEDEEPDDPPKYESQPPAKRSKT